MDGEGNDDLLNDNSLHKIKQQYSVLLLPASNYKHASITYRLCYT